MALPLSPGRTSQADTALRLTDSNSPSPKRAASPQFDAGTPQKLVGSGKLPPSPSPHRRRSGTVRAPFVPHATPRDGFCHVDLSDSRAAAGASVVPQSDSPKVIKRPWQKEVRLPVCRPTIRRNPRAHTQFRPSADAMQEDDVVRRMVELHGARQWSVIAEQLPGRVGKQCRERCAARASI